MADQALNRSMLRTLSTRHGREVSVAIAGSIAIHALVLGYLALRGLQGAETPWPGPTSDPILPYHGMLVELVPLPPGAGRHVRLSRVFPHNKIRAAEIPAERSPDFHPPEPGRLTSTLAPSLDAAPRRGLSGPASDGADRARPAPFSGAAHISTLACRTLAETLTLEEQAICDERFGRTASGARAIGGTNNPARDARFAAEGEAELRAYEALRAPLKPPTPCEGADLMGRCPSIITIPLFSRKF